MRGGYREGSGRKKGFAAKSAEESRKRIASIVSGEIESITKALIEKAKQGDVRAATLLFDRAWGRPFQMVLVNDEEQYQTLTDLIKSTLSDR